MSETQNNPQNGNSATPTRKQAVVVQVSLHVLIGDRDGRRVMNTRKLGGDAGIVLEHSPEEYTALYGLIEEHLDVLQNRLDGVEPKEGADASGTTVDQTQVKTPSGSF
jgi:hypothetical protein